MQDASRQRSMWQKHSLPGALLKVTRYQKERGSERERERERGREGERQTDRESERERKREREKF
jgi:hypothetical protein